MGEMLDFNSPAAISQLISNVLHKKKKKKTLFLIALNSSQGFHSSSGNIVQSESRLSDWFLPRYVTNDPLTQAQLWAEVCFDFFTLKSIFNTFLKSISEKLDKYNFLYTVVKKKEVWLPSRTQVCCTKLSLSTSIGRSCVTKYSRRHRMNTFLDCNPSISSAYVMMGQSWYHWSHTLWLFAVQVQKGKVPFRASNESLLQARFLSRGVLPWS